MKRAAVLFATFVYLAAFLTGCAGERENLPVGGTFDLPADTLAPETSATVQTTEAVTTEATTVTEQTTEAATTEVTTVSEDAEPAMAESEISDIPEEDDEDENLIYIQENSIAWLNYLAMLSQEINSSKNSKMFLEEAYAALINNTNPANVNELTESYLVSLLDNIEKYRMIAVKRERLQYIYDQNKAKAIREAIPNPIGLLSAAGSFDIKGLVLSVAYMAVDSISSYSNYNDEIEQDYLKDGWELDDEEAETLHDSRKRAFTYMIDIVRQDNLPGELALNESAIEKFVQIKNNDNTHQQIQFLESERETYKSFGNYWLLLVECYYDNGQYDKCLESVDEYEKLRAGIFRKDYYLAKTLPIAIASAKEELSESDYVETALKYLQMIEDNTESDEWSLRYFAAEIYVELYSITQDEQYLKKAYDLALNNVNYLIGKQNSLNAEYISDVKEIPIPNDADKKEKKQIKEYNKLLKENRKAALPEIYEPLALNCELLFSVAENLDLSKAEMQRIDGILYGSENGGFMNESIKNHFSFGKDDADITAEYDKNRLVLPVSCVTDGATVIVTVTSETDAEVYDDWTVDEVVRPSDDFSEFTVVYTSKAAKDCKWTADSKVRVDIFNGEYTDGKPIVLNFKVSNYKEKKFLIPASFDFEQVK